MIENDKLRYRSPLTNKAKSSLILEYSQAGLLVELADSECGMVVKAVLLNELYGDLIPPDVSPKALGVYYAIIGSLEMKGGEWIQACKRNKQNSDQKGKTP